ncbi:hypothetical protein [Paenibacillus ferrarius]|uniref:hypothetical protein n=1 Tax=Paenibacillus ferrarius TaxID=1469647 RepID=UPI003D2C8F0A
MSYKCLTPEQAEQFMEWGWVKVIQAFPREQALLCQDFLWDRLKERGIDRGDKSSWAPPLLFLQESYRGPAFDPCNTQRMADAIEDLVGEGRWLENHIYDGTEQDYPTWGWWPVNFSNGSDREWTVPKDGWHWDGQHFRHYVDSPDQGLLCLCVFSEIKPHGGGTIVVEGSHKVVARYLSQFPEGVDVHEAIRELNAAHPWLAELTGHTGNPDTTAEERIERFMNQHTEVDGIRLRVIETTSSPGDVILCHPFLYHAWSQNHSGNTRFMCNRTTPLKERMNLNRENPSDHSPLEISIRRALGYE